MSISDKQVMNNQHKKTRKNIHARERKRKSIENLIIQFLDVFDDVLLNVFLLLMVVVF